MGMSSWFHTVACHSSPVCCFWNKADYVGIVWLTVSSFVPIVYYGFWCSRVLQAVYLGMIILLGSITVRKAF
jgi:adiponectin receptor